MDQDDGASSAAVAVVQANAIHLDERALGWMPVLGFSRDEVIDQGERAKGTNDASDGPSVAASAT
ncbi:hypothetical protein [Muricoccus aerilatus]|uniref:hypothetical protein n=1 Tax=Muricoccus aerilatus TaxID=452982 RepID=UPI001B806118|nr:hypothetical protein [Roseomonas aerilata]